MSIQLKARLEDLLEKGVLQEPLVEKIYETGEDGCEIVLSKTVNAFRIDGIGVVRSYHPEDLVIDNQDCNDHIRSALDVLGVKYTRG